MAAFFHRLVGDLLLKINRPKAIFAIRKNPLCTE